MNLQPARDEWPNLRPRLPTRDELRSSLWFWPAVAALLALATGAVLGNIHPTADSRLGRWAWPGDRDSAIAFLQVVAGSVITVTSLTFTLVVVALQLASQQFSPRLLREFARDPATQLVLGVLVSTFVISVTVLRSLDGDQPVPALGLGLTFVMALLSITALLGFLGHIARLVRVDTMMAAVHRETRQALEKHYLPYGQAQDQRDLALDIDADATLVSAKKSGFVQHVDVQSLVEVAREMDAVVVVGIRPGDQVVMGTPIARYGAPPGSSSDAVTRAVHDAIHLGYERTLEQDVGLGLRQLTDISVKALSPGINDPTTAGHSIGHLTDILVRLQGRRLGPMVHLAGDGTPRVQTPDRDMRYYLDLVVGPIRRYGAREPTVMVALLRMLRDVAVAACDDEQRQEIARQAGLIVATLPADLLDDDAEAVHDAERRVYEVLRGETARAYTDRAGETRSL